MDKPAKLETLMYALMKEARRDSFMEFIDDWDISVEEYDEISAWFKETLDIKL